MAKRRDGCWLKDTRSGGALVTHSVNKTEQEGNLS
jgi:hypothetical protein